MSKLYFPFPVFLFLFFAFSGQAKSEGDLSLITLGVSQTFPVYQYVSCTFVLKNEGNAPMDNVIVEAVVPFGSAVLKGGDEYNVTKGVVRDYWTTRPFWHVGTMNPGETAALTLNIFTLTGSEISIYAQVSNAIGTDADSHPGNGVCCSPNEDDETVFIFNPGGGPALVPDLSLSNLVAPSSARAGDQVNYSFDLNNTGLVGALGDYAIGVFLSSDDLWGPNDYMVGFVNTGNTPVGTIPNVPGIFTLPLDRMPGDYYLIFFADRDNRIIESNEHNNRVIMPFKVEAPLPDIDLAWKQSKFVPQAVARGEQFNTDIEFYNTGANTSTAFDISFYLSVDNRLDRFNDVKLFSYRVFDLVPSGFGSGTTSFNPITMTGAMQPGIYKLLVVLDDKGEVNETDEADNIFITNIQLLASGRPDLLTTELSGVPTDAVMAGTTLNLEMNYANLGTAAVKDVFFGKIYFSNDAQVSADDVVLSEFPFNNYPIIHFGYSRSGIAATIPQGTLTGNYYLIVCIDAYENIAETSEINNKLIKSFKVEGVPVAKVDLELSMTATNYHPNNYSNFSVILKLKNLGSQIVTDVRVKVAKPDEVVYEGGNEYSRTRGFFSPYGDEIWTVGSLQAGAVATLTINYYRLSANEFPVYAQVITQNELDYDSSPGNGSCCTVPEDDEAMVQIAAAPFSLADESDEAIPVFLSEMAVTLQVFPNPATDVVNLKITSDDEQPGRVGIYNQTGVEMWRAEAAIQKGTNTIQVNVADFPAGVYYIVTPNAGRSSFIKTGF